MFSLVNNLFTLILTLLIGLPLLAIVVYFAAYFAQGLFGGSIWLWMIGLFILGIIGIKEELSKDTNNSTN